jgi:hypothetical protein
LTTDAQDVEVGRDRGVDVGLVEARGQARVVGVGEIEERIRLRGAAGLVEVRVRPHVQVRRDGALAIVEDVEAELGLEVVVVLVRGGAEAIARAQEAVERALGRRHGRERRVEPRDAGVPDLLIDTGRSRCPGGAFGRGLLGTFVGGLLRGDRAAGRRVLHRLALRLGDEVVLDEPLFDGHRGDRLLAGGLRLGRQRLLRGLGLGLHGRRGIRLRATRRRRPAGGPRAEHEQREGEQAPALGGVTWNSARGAHALLRYKRPVLLMPMACTLAARAGVVTLRARARARMRLRPDAGPPLGAGRAAATRGVGAGVARRTMCGIR